METIKIKSIAIGELMCLLPIVLGMAFRDIMPYENVVPFLSGKFAERDFIIFGIPFFMAFLHIFLCLLCDVISADRTRGNEKRILVKSIIPILNFILYLAIIIYVLGPENDIVKICSFVFGAILITLGLFAINTENYNFVKMKKGRVKSRAVRRFNVFLGLELLGLGGLFSVSVFLSSVFTAIFVVLLFAVIIITIAVAQSIRSRSRR